MRRRSVILIFLIVTLPMVLLTWAGFRMAADEQAIAEERFESLLEGRLNDINRTIARHFSDFERKLQSVTAVDETSAAAMRERQQREPTVLQFFVLDPDGDLVYPNPADELNQSERSFLVRASRMFSGQELYTEVIRQEAGRPAVGPSPLAPQSQRQTSPASQQSSGQRAISQERSPYFVSGASGWFVWYWDGGMHLIYWQRRPSGEIVGAALDRARWISDLIAVLPDSPAQIRKTSEVDALELEVQLLDAGSTIVYQWGGLDDPGTGTSEAELHNDPAAELPVVSPLGAWRLQCVMPESQRTAFFRSSSIYAGLVGGFIAAGAALTGLAILLYRDYSRDMREAAQQVSFVNQVSHELKTPLTNIRLYAELLEQDLEVAESDVSQRGRDRLSVITQEAQRLSRLINNVLTFARQQRRSLRPTCRDTNVPELIRDILLRFEPSMKAGQIEVEFSDQDTGIMKIDPDFVEQILGNLISNVEKYAADGKSMKIKARRPADAQHMLEILVTDKGPGIAPSKQSELFKPFSRLSHHIHHTSGTGIGLSIARELARLHGGNLELQPTTTGCCFRITLNEIFETPPPAKPGEVRQA